MASKQTQSSADQSGLRDDVTHGAQLYSSIYFGFNCYYRMSFSHFVMQHKVCVFNVKRLNENVVLHFKSPVVALKSRCFDTSVISL